MAPPTILAHKSAFLTAQTLHLSQDLEPSAAFYRAASANNDDDDNVRLSAKALDDALSRLNHTLQRHVRRVYTSQGRRHVAEQIECLLLDQAAEATKPHPDDGGDGDGEDNDGGEQGNGGSSSSNHTNNNNILNDVDALRLSVDLTTDPAIAALPPTWSAHRPREAEAHPPEARRYEDLHGQLAALAARRRDTRARVERLRRMQTLLQPFADSSSSANNNEPSSETNNTQPNKGNDKTPTITVQDNLVTRNGPVEKELERMRMLLVRVTGRVAQLPPPRDEPGVVDPHDLAGRHVVDDPDEVERRKVQSLLGAF